MLLSPLKMSHELIKSSVLLGDKVVDATLGNGHDTLFLAQCVGETGMVYGFDVQEQALKNSGDLLDQKGIKESSYQLLLESHNRIVDFCPKGLGAVMFNLGYLPNADKRIITQLESTLIALEQSRSLVKVGGVISIMCYPSHKGGDGETQAVCEWASHLPRKEYKVVQYQLFNAANNPAFLIFVERQE